VTTASFSTGFRINLKRSEPFKNYPPFSSPSSPMRSTETTRSSSAVLNTITPWVERPAPTSTSPIARASRRYPWAALNIYNAFAAARAEVIRTRDNALHRHIEPGLIGDDVRRVLAADPMVYGVKANRKVLETITQYVHEQGLTARRVGLEEMFAPSTIDL